MDTRQQRRLQQSSSTTHHHQHHKDGTMEQVVTNNLQTLENLLGMDETQAGNFGGGGKSQKAQTEHASGSGLEFDNLTYSVVKKQKKNGKWESMEVDLLQGITGQALRGQVTAIMGPSGAGKSTFLDALAGRIAQGSLGGTLHLEGKQVTSSYIKRVSAYVMQQDFLFPMLTVTETLMFSAEVRLPSSVSHFEKAERVQTLIKQLGLQSAAHTYIGDEGNRGVSGGERRRVSIGVDIIHGPSLCFLDEPTSGLDSTSALGVVEKLYDIAASGSIVLLTIHQPSYRIQMLLGSLIVLARGKLIYQGSPGDLTGHLEAFGREVPVGENSIEYLLDVIKEFDESNVGLDPLLQFQRDGVKPDQKKTVPRAKTPLYGKPPLDNQNLLSIEEEGEGFDHSLTSLRGPHTPGLRLASHFYDDFLYRTSWSFTPGRTPIHTPMFFTAGTPRNAVTPSRSSFQEGTPQTKGGMRDGSSPVENSWCEPQPHDIVESDNGTTLGPKYANSWGREVMVLMWRNYKNVIRTPELFLSREIVIIVMSAMLSSLFKRPPLNIDGVNQLLSFYVFILSLLFFSSNDAVPTFIQERYIFIRETGHNAYRASSYTIAGLIVYLPFLAIQALTCVILTWWVLGLQGGPVGFIVFWLILYASLITTNSFVVFVSAIVPNYITGYAAVIALTALSFLTCGFFIKGPEVPGYWKWLHYLSTMKYPFEALLMNEFQNEHCFSLHPVVPSPGPLGNRVQIQPLNGTSPPCYLTGHMILESMEINQLNISGSILILLLWGVFYRFLFYVILRFWSGNERK